MDLEIKKIKQLTNRWGIYQHGKLDKPNPKFGYAVEDQARALLMVEDLSEKKLANVYFKFIINALSDEGNIWQFFYDIKSGIKPDKSTNCSEDGLGMVAWALMKTKKRNPKKEKILKIILNKAKNWYHLRSISYLILGLTSKDKSELEDNLTNKILKSYKEDGDWQWFEDKLSYGNALIPWALWKRGRIRKDKESTEIAKKATKFLLMKNLKNNVPMPVSHLGLKKDDKERLYFDQQPIEVTYTILCLCEAYKNTKNIFYKKMAKKWWGWFWGNNINKVKLIDDNFACYDGLTDKFDKVNLNQGAESNICFLMAYQAVKKLGLIN